MKEIFKLIEKLEDKKGYTIKLELYTDWTGSVSKGLGLYRVEIFDFLNEEQLIENLETLTK